MAASPASTQGPFRLLVIEQRDEDVRAIEEALQPQVTVQRATKLDTARLMLRKHLFEVILVNRELPVEKKELLGFIRRITLEVPVVVYTSEEDRDVVLEMMKAGASDCLCKKEQKQHLSRLRDVLQGAVARNLRVQQQRERLHTLERTRMMETLRATVSKVTHDINNPLAIISGNAQLLIELGRYMDLDDEIIKPIKDIEEASSRIAASLHKLADLKEMVKQEIAQGDGSLMELDEDAIQPSNGSALPGTRSQTRA
ncbi:MAG TPA: response regulator [Rhodothermales bacterium]|nr:response regulator [Rhodothermales bacterium]